MRQATYYQLRRSRLLWIPIAVVGLLIGSGLQCTCTRKTQNALDLCHADVKSITAQAEQWKADRDTLAGLYNHVLNLDSIK